MKPSSSVMDVTKPGDERSRGEGIKAVEELGSMPIIYTPWLNKGARVGSWERAGQVTFVVLGGSSQG